MILFSFKHETVKTVKSLANLGCSTKKRAAFKICLAFNTWNFINELVSFSSMQMQKFI